MGALRAVIVVAASVFATGCSGPLLHQCSGGEVGQPYRGVQAYSNTPWQGKPVSCGGDEDHHRGSYGYAYQCVELVRRFYATNDGPHRGNHNDSWPRDHAVGLWHHAAAMGLARFANGEVHGERPQPDDIVVFKGTPTQPVGHVAIVIDVTDTAIRLWEQNWSPKAYVTLPATLRADGTYFIPARDSFAVRGWMGQR